MSDYRITTQKALRASFWANHTHLQRVPGRTQNGYPVDTRTAFCDYVDNLARNGEISETLAQRATL